MNTIGYHDFSKLLTLVFITLQLTENINWSWWLVLSPLIIAEIIHIIYIFIEENL